MNTEQETWFCWVIKGGKYEIVSQFLEESIPEVVSVYYPYIQKERSVYGKVVVRDVPLFAGYMFIKYKSSDRVHYKLKQHPYITTYIGKCKEDDISSIEGIKERESNKEFVSKRHFDVDDNVLIVNGHFINFKGVVKRVDKKRYFVEIPIFNRKALVSCSIDDLVSEDKDLFEW